MINAVKLVLFSFQIKKKEKLFQLKWIFKFLSFVIRKSKMNFFLFLFAGMLSRLLNNQKSIVSPLVTLFLSVLLNIKET